MLAELTMKAPDGITNDELGEFIMADVQGPVASPVAGALRMPHTL